MTGYQILLLVAILRTADQFTSAAVQEENYHGHGSVTLKGVAHNQKRGGPKENLVSDPRCAKYGEYGSSEYDGLRYPANRNAKLIYCPIGPKGPVCVDPAVGECPQTNEIGEQNWEEYYKQQKRLQMKKLAEQKKKVGLFLGLCQLLAKMKAKNDAVTSDA